ncbi:unnamed protein product [Didymodactylos carnosus]|uniref:Bromo domain-containing protein n=1 Tax=Didymodactylos carnosus TaxID=1234261 RepID=A0A813SVW1_9BILA|nr:unnamed protein product [Didymodactylos carnosus]CAF0838965.1 unnamed protein product [Didymodactylos carnosus]CAF3587351.1 unnamed protein product [Didymodactylos carnosus]CAF3623880.1 unnamed protein product [Didymodactylos carnosus]
MSGRAIKRRKLTTGLGMSGDNAMSFVNDDDLSNQAESSIDGVGGSEFDEDSMHGANNSMSNSFTVQSHFNTRDFALERLRRQTKQTIVPIDDNSHLTACLEYLYRTLSRKDKEGFFQFPVTDQLAPGYSQIIRRPMDFSAIKKKILQEGYQTIMEFRQDFELMCQNAVAYNRSETIYFQAAKKLLALGTKLMSKDKLLSFRRSLECFAHLTEKEFGFKIENAYTTTTQMTTMPIAENESLVEPQLVNTDQHTNNVGVEGDSMEQPVTNNHLSTVSISAACSQRKNKYTRLPKYYEKLTTLMNDEDEDELLPEEILAQAQQAAQCAREKLSLRHPVSQYGLSCQRENGATSLRFINQDDNDDEREKQQHTTKQSSFNHNSPARSISSPTTNIITNTSSLAANRISSLMNNEPSITCRTITIGELNNDGTSTITTQYYTSSSSITTTIINEAEKRNHLSPRYFLDYGPFSSNAPSYDSSFSSITKDELDLLIHTYGSEFSTAYSVSLLDYVKDPGELAMAYVDRLLNVLTNGEHENYALKQKQQKEPLKTKIQSDGLNKTITVNEQTTSIDPSVLEFTNLESSTLLLSNTSDSTMATDEIRQEIVDQPIYDEHTAGIDMKLDETSKLLFRLRRAQYDRLSQPVNTNHVLSNSEQPQNEYELAQKILNHLTDLTKETKPEYVVDPQTIRQTIGVVVKEEPTRTTTNVDQQILDFELKTPETTQNKDQDDNTIKFNDPEQFFSYE